MPSGRLSLAAQLWCEAVTARLRPGSRAAYFSASVTASRRLQFASRGAATPQRQPPCRSGFGTRNWPCSLHQGRWPDGTLAQRSNASVRRRCLAIPPRPVVIRVATALTRPSFLGRCCARCTFGTRSTRSAEARTCGARVLRLHGAFAPRRPRAVFGTARNTQNHVLCKSARHFGTRSTRSVRAKYLWRDRTRVTRRRLSWLHALAAICSTS